MKERSQNNIKMFEEFFYRVSVRVAVSTLFFTTLLIITLTVKRGSLFLPISLITVGYFGATLLLYYSPFLKLTVDEIDKSLTIYRKIGSKEYIDFQGHFGELSLIESSGMSREEWRTTLYYGNSRGPKFIIVSKGTKEEWVISHRMFYNGRELKQILLRLAYPTLEKIAETLLRR